MYYNMKQKGVSINDMHKKRICFLADITKERPVKGRKRLLCVAGYGIYDLPYGCQPTIA